MKPRMLPNCRATSNGRVFAFPERLIHTQQLAR